MKTGPRGVIAIFLFAVIAFPAFTQRVAILPAVVDEGDTRLAALRGVVTGTIDLNLRILGDYELVDGVDSPLTPQLIANTAEAHRQLSILAGERSLDYIIFTQISAEGIDISIRAMVFDVLAGATTFERQEEVVGILSVFDAADAITEGLLEAFRGEQLSFGTIRLQPASPGNYAVLIDGVPVGTDTREQRVIAGERVVEVFQSRMLGRETIHSQRITVRPGETGTVRFDIPVLLEHEAEQVATYERIVRANWEFSDERQTVENAFAALHSLLSETGFSPSLAGERERIEALSDEYAAHAAAGFPFDPERFLAFGGTAYEPSVERLKAHYGYREIAGSQNLLRSGRALFRGGSPWSVSIHGGWGGGCVYMPGFDEYCIGDELFTAGVEGRFDSPRTLFSAFAGLDVARAAYEYGDSFSGEDFSVRYDSNEGYLMGSVSAGAGLKRDYFRRMRAGVDVGLGLYLYDWYFSEAETDLDTGESTTLEDEAGTDLLVDALIRLSLEYALSPRIDAGVSFTATLGPSRSAEWDGIDFHSAVGRATLRILLGQPRSAYPRFADRQTEREVDVQRRNVASPRIGESERREAAAELVVRYASAGEAATAERVFEEYRAEAARSPLPTEPARQTARALLALAASHYQAGDFEAARERYRLASEAGSDDKQILAYALAGMVRASYELGEEERTRVHFIELARVDRRHAAELSYAVAQRPERSEFEAFRRLIYFPGSE